VKDKLFRLSSTERERLFEQIASELATQPDVAFAYALGSSLAEPSFHDIDVALYLSGPVAKHGARTVDLADRLTRALGVPVDVQPLNDAPVAFVFHALRGRLLFSRDDERLALTIEETVPRYLDAAPLVRQATREAFAS
jgi:predicted nucleotidyltransferase